MSLGQSRVGPSVAFSIEARSAFGSIQVRARVTL